MGYSEGDFEYDDYDSDEEYEDNDTFDIEAVPGLLTSFNDLQTQPVEKHESALSFVFVVDLSKSMGERIKKGERKIDAVLRSVREFLTLQEHRDEIPARQPSLRHQQELAGDNSNESNDLKGSTISKENTYSLYFVNKKVTIAFS